MDKEESSFRTRKEQHKFIRERRAWLAAKTFIFDNLQKNCAQPLIFQLEPGLQERTPDRQFFDWVSLFGG